MNELQKLLTPYDTEFTKKRFGPNRDSGYVLMEEIIDLCDVVYSFGVNALSECQVDFQLSEMGKKIKMFDINDVSYLHQLNSNMTFQKCEINSSVVEKLLDEETSNNILICSDIEGGEFNTFIDIDDRYFTKINQISIELHWLSQEEHNWLKFLEKLNKYFILTHIHGNNHRSISSYGIPEVVELTYINRKFLKQSPKISCEQYPIKNLDFPNQFGVEDFKLNWWK